MAANKIKSNVVDLPGSKQAQTALAANYGRELGKRISETAKVSGGKRALAEITGLQESQIYKYIRGENIPGVNVIIEISQGSGVSLEWLATGEGPMSRQDESDELAKLQELVKSKDREIKLLTKEVDLLKKEIELIRHDSKKR